MQHGTVITGNTVSLKRLGVIALLAVVSAAHGSSASRTPKVPEGFTARIYARDLAGARDLRVEADGTLRVRGTTATFEIKPPGDGAPLMVLKVATELDREDLTPVSELTAPVESTPMTIPIPIAMETLALARELDSLSFTDVALSPDGTLFVADARAGIVYEIRRIAGTRPTL